MTSLTQKRRAALAQASTLWLDPSATFRRDAVAALQVSTGYMQAQVEAALDAAFGELTAAHLDAYAASAPLVGACRTLTVLHIAAGNVFTAWLHGATITLLLNHRLRIKPSAAEPVFAALWRRSLMLQDPNLGSDIQLTAQDESLYQAVDAVVAYGSDETLNIVQLDVGALPFIGYGHKASSAIFFKEALTSLDRWIDAVTRDIAAFRLQGCLSPQTVYVEGDVSVVASAVKARLPATPQPRWTSFEDIHDVWADLALLQDHLSCLGVAGSEKQQAMVAQRWKNRSDIRICRLGEMQRPPLSWRNGGVSLGEFLLKCSRI